MIEIKEGTELDRAVAEKIGLVCTGLVLDSGAQFFVDPRDPLPGVRTFQPSYDWNDMFFAAEAVKLFEGRWLGRLVTGWTVMELDTMKVIGPDEGCATPALAVCAAILSKA